MSDPILTDALALAHRAAQHALAVLAGTTGLDQKATGQVTAALSSALVSLDVAHDYAQAAPPVQLWVARCMVCPWYTDPAPWRDTAAQETTHHHLPHAGGQARTTMHQVDQ